MIFLIDLSSSGVQHEQFNKSFIDSVMLNSGSEEEIVFWAEESHLKPIRLLYADEFPVEMRPIHFYSGKGNVKEFIRGYKQYRELLRILDQASESQVREVYILLIHPVAHYLFKRKYRKYPFRIKIVLHGELHAIKMNHGSIKNIKGRLLAAALMRPDENVQYIVLGQSIYENINRILPDFINQKVIIFDHPYPFVKYAGIKKWDTGALILSSFGVVTRYKKSQYLFELAKDIIDNKEYGAFERVQVRALGKVYSDMLPYLNDYVDHKPVGASYSRDELLTATYQSHFSLFYYAHQDSLVASGAFWDSINAETPLLYIKNDYFDHYASLVGGIGYRFETPEQLNNFVKRTIREGLNKEEYLNFIENIRVLKYDKMTLNNIAPKLRILHGKN